MIANEQIPKNNFFIYLFLNAWMQRFFCGSGRSRTPYPVKIDLREMLRKRSVE